MREIQALPLRNNHLLHYLRSSLSSELDKRSLGGKRSSNERDWLPHHNETRVLPPAGRGFGGGSLILYIAPVLVQLVVRARRCQLRDCTQLTLQALVVEDPMPSNDSAVRVRTRGRRALPFAPNARTNLTRALSRSGRRPALRLRKGDFERRLPHGQPWVSGFIQFHGGGPRPSRSSVN